MHDVVIVGGGPIGSHAARRLAEYGHRVLVLEKNARPGAKTCCTGIVGLECVNTFEVDSRVILRRLHSAMLYSPSGDSLHVFRNEPQACVLDRAAFDVMMAERAQRAGAEYHFQSRVTGVTVANGQANVTVSRGDKESKISAQAAVIASGFTPGLLERAGLGVFKDYVTGAQVETETPGLEEAEVYFGDVAPGFFAWLVPTSPGMGRVGLLARRDVGQLLKNWLRQLATQGKIAAEDSTLHYGAIPLSPPARTYCERILAVGDAAGQVKPTSGGGIFYGLLGADIAAETLFSAFQEDDFSAKKLARYERAWRKRLGGELRTGYWARQIFEKMGNRQIDRLFSVMKKSGIDTALLLADDVSFDWHGRTIKRVLKYQVITKTLGIVKLPFRSRSIDP